LGTNGSLGFLFERKGIFTLKKQTIEIEDLEELEMDLIDFGLEELTAVEDEVIIQTSFDDYGKMQSQLDDKKLIVSNAELQRIPVDTTKLAIDNAQKVMKLIDKMEEDDDVNAVYHNLEITEELINSL
jgi:transcriptional/translational regulatory protein YebC/TACO1